MPLIARVYGRRTSAVSASCPSVSTIKVRDEKAIEAIKRELMKFSDFIAVEENPAEYETEIVCKIKVPYKEIILRNIMK